MPLFDETQERVLVFSGEEYPGPETARKLRDAGHTFPLKGPSYLVHAYEGDRSFPASLNGIFHGLAVDRLQGEVLLFNDRYGMHRLYFHEAADAFYFAGEAKAILAVRPELRTIDPRGLGEFVSCGCVLENRTLFKNVYALPSGSGWRFRNKSLDRKTTYFHARDWEAQAELEPEDYYRELRDVFARNLPRYFNGSERVALALTGGLDTRLLMAWRKAEPNSLPCYTFGSMYRENEDVRVARHVAQLCRQPHSVIATGSAFLSRFPEYAERTVHVTDGSIDVGRAPDLYVSEQARAIAPVKVVGTYGSEMLTDVPAFKPLRLASGLFGPANDVVRQAEATYAAARVGHPVTFAAFRQSPWWHHGILALEQSQLTVRSPYLDTDFMQTVYRAPAAASVPRDVRRRLIADGSPALAKVATDRGVGGDGGVRSAMRRAWLDFTLKAEFAYDYGMPRWLAQIDRRLSWLRPERLFLGHHRMFHFRVWYRDALAAYVREMLFDSRALGRPYVTRSVVEAVVGGHLAGNHNYTREIHKLLSLELVHRVFVDAH